MNKSTCTTTSTRCNDNNRFGDFFIILVLFILLAIIVSAVFTY